MNRQGFIGGSDARRIMEGDWHNLWLEKTGRAKSADLSENIAVQLGVATEDFNLDWFDKHHIANGYDNLARQRQYSDTYCGVPCKGTVDAKLQDGSESIVEAKHTYERNTMESCIRQYMPQIQFYMRLADAKHCYLSVIFGNRRWEAVAVARDDTYIDNMMVHIAEFWKCVTSDTEPAVGKQPTSLTTDHIRVDDMVRRDASGDNEFISRAHDYIEAEGMAKSFESAKADLKAMVANDEREVYCDLLTIKRDKRGSLRISVKENTDG